MKRFDLYGLSDVSLDDARALLESLLDIALVRHESGFRGGDYFRSSSNSEELILQRNLPDEEGYPPEPDFTEYDVLIYINGSDRWENIQSWIAESVAFTTLRSEVY